MTTYTLAELLNHFFYTQQNPEKPITQGELAEAVGISRRAMAAWFAGSCMPRTEEQIQRIATKLALSPLQHDLLTFAVNPQWVHHSTPVNVLGCIELNSHGSPDQQEQQVPLLSPLVLSAVLIEQLWQTYFYEDFAANHQRWGTGTKDNGCGRITRQLANQRYQLTLKNRYHDDVYMGGDSNCFAPPIYYYSVYAQSIACSDSQCSYGLIVDAINDEHHTFFRIYEQRCNATIVQKSHCNSVKRHLRQLPLPALRPGKKNKLAVLAIHDEHWLYINDQVVCYQRLPRITIGRLDVGVAAGVGQETSCEFGMLRVLIPPSEIDASSTAEGAAQS